MYTKKRFGQELEMALNQKYDVVELSRWAESVHSHHCRELEDDLYDIVEIVAMMELSPEFEYTEQELRTLARLLQNDETNLMEKLSSQRK